MAWGRFAYAKFWSAMSFFHCSGGGSGAAASNNGKAAKTARTRRMDFSDDWRDVSFYLYPVSRKIRIVAATTLSGGTHAKDHIHRRAAIGGRHHRRRPARRPARAGRPGDPARWTR